MFFVPVLTMAAPPALVTNGNNDGPGSLRAALASGAGNIVIKGSVDTIVVESTLTYSGTAALRITGSGQALDASDLDDDILAISQGADLAVSNLSLVGPGDYKVYFDGDKYDGGKGIFVGVPETREGVVSVKLTNVSVYGTGNHGVHISDCSLGDDCGGGSGGGGNGSPASIDVALVDVTIDGVGFGRQDADGLRVDERADGDIIFSASNSTFINVGADGVELDEGNNGDVILDVRNSYFRYNGEYCLLDTDINNGDQKCLDDGDPDVDDGFDVDEAGAGSITGKVSNLTVAGNYDEGLDFDEEDAGGFDLEITSVYAINNEDEGIKLSEEDEGSINVSLNSVDLQNNNGSKEDSEIEEADEGTVAVIVNGSLIDELKVEEDGTDEGTIKVRGSSFLEPLDLDNINEI
jgi:hypothetical protein